MTTAALFQRYYFSRPGYVSGTIRFHEMIRAGLPPNPEILEIGSGPGNPTSDCLCSFGRLTGIDVDEAVLSNRALANAMTFNGEEFPFPGCSFDICVSNYVLEHVVDCAKHFREVARVMKPGGLYFFRTPNLWHYVTIASRLLPHSVHQRFANKLRGREGGNDPYPTVYRANTTRAIRKHGAGAGLAVKKIEMVGPE